MINSDLQNLRKLEAIQAFDLRNHTYWWFNLGSP